MTMAIRNSFEHRYDATIAERPGVGHPTHAFAAGGAGARAVTVVVEPWYATSWTAEFAAPDPGIRALSGIFSTPNPDGLCVIERGTAFLGDVLTPRGFAVVQTRGPVVDVTEILSSGLLLLLTPWSITALDAQGSRWTTERIAIEALRLDEVSDGWARGWSDPEDDAARRFAVELSSGRVEFKTKIAP